MSKGDNVRPHDKKRFDKNFEAIFGEKELKTWDPNEENKNSLLDMLDVLDDDLSWRDCPRADGRMEWLCPHGVGHGNHIHGCCGCCQRDDYPGRRQEVPFFEQCDEIDRIVEQGERENEQEKRT